MKAVKLSEINVLQQGLSVMFPLSVFFLHEAKTL